MKTYLKRFRRYREERLGYEYPYDYDGPPFEDLVTETIQANQSAIFENIARNNAFMRRLLNN